MKKIFTIIAVMFAFANFSFAQELSDATLALFNKLCPKLEKNLPNTKPVIWQEQENYLYNRHEMLVADNENEREHTFWTSKVNVPYAKPYVTKPCVTEKGIITFASSFSNSGWVTFKNVVKDGKISSMVTHRYEIKAE